MTDTTDQSSDNNGKVLYCSFCGKSQHEVRKLIAGPSVFVCIVEPANLEPEVEEVEVQEPVESQVSSVTQQEPVAEETKTKTPATKKTLKGGLARAVAKTREYEEKKNKPKRL